jgi:hypothetical protein
VRYVPVEQLENRVDRYVEIDVRLGSEAGPYPHDEVALLAFGGGRKQGIPSLEKDAAYQDRKLCGQVSHFFWREPIAKGRQHGLQKVVGTALAPAEIFGELVYPLLRLLGSMCEVRN